MRNFDNKKNIKFEGGYLQEFSITSVFLLGGIGWGKGVPIWKSDSDLFSFQTILFIEGITGILFENNKFIL